MNKKILFIDMDNVLVDFQSGINRLQQSVQDAYAGRLDEVPGIFALMEPNPGAMQTLDLQPLDFHKPSGLAFLPDGQHYVVSCANGFAVLKRGMHELVAERSVRLQLGWHSHMAAG